MTRVFNYEEGLHSIKVENDKVMVKAKGSESYQSGEYMNERNVTLDVELTHEQILEAAEEIQSQRGETEIDKEELQPVQEVETKPGYQVVIRTEGEEYIQVGPNPWIFAGPKEDEE